MSSQTVSRRPRPRRQPVQKRSHGTSDSKHDEIIKDVSHNEEGVGEVSLSGGSYSPRRRLVSHHMSPRRKLERSPVRRAHHHAMLKPPLSLSPNLSPTTRSKGSAETTQGFPLVEDNNESHHTPSRSKVRRRPAIGKLTIRVQQLKAENLMAVTYQVPLEIKSDSVKQIGETLVQTIKQPTTLTRAIMKTPDTLLKTPGHLVSKTSDALKKSADVFVQLHYFDYGWKTGPKTSIQKRTCSPEWPEVLELQLGADAAQALLKSGERLELRLWNHDTVVGDSFLGSVQIPLLSEDKDKTAYRVLKRSPNDSSLHSHHATGELTAHVSLHAEAIVDLHRGELFPLEQSKITLGLSCRTSQLESSLVVLDRHGRVMWPECAYNDNCTTDSVRISYNDSESKDLLYYHMDRCVIQLELETLPKEALALFLVVHVPSEDASVHLRVLETDSKIAMARYFSNPMKEPHSVILSRISRNANGWFVASIGENFSHVQDFGNLLPIMNKFVEDLITTQVDRVSATTVLGRRKPIVMSQGSEQWKLRISWNDAHSNGGTDSLSTSALLLDGDFHVMDQVGGAVDSSRTGGVIYRRGWRPKRSEKFEDFLVEKIEAINLPDETTERSDFTDEFILNFSKLSARVQHVCFNITSLPRKSSQNEVGTIEKVDLQLHDEIGHNELARFVSPVSNGSGLLLACFSRRQKDAESSWVFEVASVSASPVELGKQWKSFFTTAKHADPYEIVNQHSEQLDLVSRKMPVLTVVDAEPTTIPDDILLKCLF